MKDMQIGGKIDESGWDVYEESRRGGAIVERCRAGRGRRALARGGGMRCRATGGVGARSKRFQVVEAHGAKQSFFSLFTEACISY